MKLKIAYPVKVYLVRSSHRHPDTGKFEYYRVELYSDGKLYDNCLAGQTNQMCKHKIKAFKFIQKYEPEKILKPLKGNKKQERITENSIQNPH